MPVLDYEVSPLVIQKDGAKYGCWNRGPFQKEIYASDWTKGELNEVAHWWNATFSTNAATT